MKYTGREGLSYSPISDQCSPMFLYPMKNENIGKKQVKKNVNSFSLQKHPPEVFYKKTVLKDFATFTGKHLDGDWSLQIC